MFKGLFSPPEKCYFAKNKKFKFFQIRCRITYISPIQIEGDDLGYLAGN